MNKNRVFSHSLNEFFLFLSLSLSLLMWTRKRQRPQDEPRKENEKEERQRQFRCLRNWVYDGNGEWKMKWFYNEVYSTLSPSASYCVLCTIHHINSGVAAPRRRWLSNSVCTIQPWISIKHNSARFCSCAHPKPRHQRIFIYCTRENPKTMLTTKMLSRGACQSFFNSLAKSRPTVQLIRRPFLSLLLSLLVSVIVLWKSETISRVVFRFTLANLSRLWSPVVAFCIRLPLKLEWNIVLFC